MIRNALKNTITRHPVQPYPHVIKSNLQNSVELLLRIGQTWNTVAADSIESSPVWRDFNNNPFTSRNCPPPPPTSYPSPLPPPKAHTLTNPLRPISSLYCQKYIYLFHCQNFQINNKQRKQTGNNTPTAVNRKTKSEK